MRILRAHAHVPATRPEAPPSAHFARPSNFMYLSHTSLNPTPLCKQTFATQVEHENISCTGRWSVIRNRPPMSLSIPATAIGDCYKQIGPRFTIRWRTPMFIVYRNEHFSRRYSFLVTFAVLFFRDFYFYFLAIILLFREWAESLQVYADKILLLCHCVWALKLFKFKAPYILPLVNFSASNKCAIKSAIK